MSIKQTSTGSNTFSALQTFQDMAVPRQLQHISGAINLHSSASCPPRCKYKEINYELLTKLLINYD